jgi:hypothetical protein
MDFLKLYKQWFNFILLQSLLKERVSLKIFKELPDFKGKRGN